MLPHTNTLDVSTLSGIIKLSYTQEDAHVCGMHTLNVEEVKNVPGVTAL